MLTLNAGVVHATNEGYTVGGRHGCEPKPQLGKCKGCRRLLPSSLRRKSPCTSGLLVPLLLGLLDDSSMQGCRRLRDDPGLTQQPTHGGRWLSAHRQPILYPVNVQAQLLVPVLTCTEQWS